MYALITLSFPRCVMAAVPSPSPAYSTVTINSHHSNCRIDDVAPHTAQPPGNSSKFTGNSEIIGDIVGVLCTLFYQPARAKHAWPPKCPTRIQDQSRVVTFRGSSA
ncbi:hypothetical protein F5888DRAFT_1658462 [Russula emetica]|nr:hypothetical protein F5888DRAFT_1658462 [Russula emetica]